MMLIDIQIINFLRRNKLMSLWKVMLIKNCLSQRMCRDAIYCVLESYKIGLFIE